MSLYVADYELELAKARDAIRENEAERVLLHMPDGVKPKADEVIQELQSSVEHEFDVLVWGGSCFGACDLPVEAENVGVDLLIHWGHSRWKVTKEERHPDDL